MFVDLVTIKIPKFLKTIMVAHSTHFDDNHGMVEECETQRTICQT